MKDLKSTPFWRKSYRVDAIRLTEDNYKQVAIELGGEHFEGGSCHEPYIVLGGLDFPVGFWVVKLPNGNYQFEEHEDFLREYHAHAERNAEDEQYAKIYAHVVSAMNRQASATWNGDSNGDMDLVAIETTKSILGEF